MAELVQMTPLVPVSDLPAAIAFHDPRSRRACRIDVVGLDAPYADLEPALSRLPVRAEPDA